MSLFNLACAIEQELSIIGSFERMGEINETGGAWFYKNQTQTVSGFISCEDNTEDIGIHTVSLGVIMFDITDFNRAQIVHIFALNSSLWQASFTVTQIEEEDKLLIGRRLPADQFDPKTLNEHINDLTDQASFFLNDYFPWVMVKRGDRYFEKGKHEDALDLYNQAIDFYKTSFTSEAAGSTHDLALTLTARSICYLNLKYPKEALDDINEALEIQKRLIKEGLDTRLDLSTSLTIRGNILSDMESREEALEDFTSAVNIRQDLWEEGLIQPNDVAIPLMNRGTELYHLKRFEEALEDQSHVINLRQSLFERGKLEDVYQLVMGYINRANVYWALGTFEAWEDYNCALFYLKPLLMERDLIGVYLHAAYNGLTILDELNSKEEFDNLMSEVLSVIGHRQGQISEEGNFWLKRINEFRDVSTMPN